MSDRPFCPECDLGVNACTCELEPVFECAIVRADRAGAKRCKAQCESCRIWWGEPFEGDMAAAKGAVDDLIARIYPGIATE